MNGLMRGLRGAVLLGAGVSITACSQLGGLGNVLGGVLGPAAGSGTGGTVQGTVRAIDTQRGMLQITTTNGQTGNVYFDNRTQVVYQQQQYPVTALEQGDQIQAQLQQDQQGNYYTNYILVTRSVQESNGGYNNGGYNNGGYNTGTNSGYITTEGRVTWVDSQRGQFGLNSNRGALTVQMPYSANANDANTFRNLRQNAYVRVEGQMVSNNQLQLSRFY
jgi:hypothetical protein